jgi:hypothetical protein
MKKSKFSAFCLIVALMASAGVSMAFGQANVPAAQNVSSRPVINQAARGTTVRPSAPIVPYTMRTAVPASPRTFNSYSPRIIGQSGINLQRNYSPVARPLNPTFAALRMQRSARAGEQETITLDPVTRQRELRTLAAMRERRSLGIENRTLAAINAQRHITSHVPEGPQSETHKSLTDTATKKSRDRHDHLSYPDASRRHWHERHDRDWWHDHCNTIVFVSSGYYFLDGSYWYPAWGYDPLQTSYDYDGPIYTYGDLLPDEVIANVQVALQDAGYYSGPITGSLDVETRAALANFQRDYGLPITGAIDEPTVESLQLY